MVAMTPSLFPVDLAGVLSKLAPPLGYMRSLHRTIRSRAGRPTQRESAPASAHRSIGSETLDTLERRYHDGEALRAIANDVGMSRRRLASLLRGRGVRIRGASPPSAEVREMARLYRVDESLKRIGGAWGTQLARFGTTCSPPTSLPTPALTPRRNSPQKQNCLAIRRGSFDYLILRGANGIRTRDLLHAMQTRYQLRHSPNFLGVAVATPAILHAHCVAAKSGGRFSDVSLTHPAPSRARLTSTTAR